MPPLCDSLLLLFTPRKYAFSILNDLSPYYAKIDLSVVCFLCNSSDLFQIGLSDSAFIITYLGLKTLFADILKSISKKI